MQIQTYGQIVLFNDKLKPEYINVIRKRSIRAIGYRNFFSIQWED